MGKKSKKKIPDQMKKDVKVQFEAAPLPEEFKDCFPVGAFKMAVDNGLLTKHEVGYKGPHIASRFEWGRDHYDELMSPHAEDRDFEGLLMAHLQRMSEHLGLDVQGPGTIVYDS